jgi:WD40 repeat protein
MNKFRTALEGIDSMAVAPDGQAVAVGHYQELCLYRLTDGERVRTFALKGFAALWGITFSPDGKELAACDTGSVWVWNLATGRPRQLPLTPRNATANVDVRYSPDGRTLICVGPVLARWRTRGKKELPNRDFGAELMTRAVAFTPDSATLAVCSAAQAKKGTAFRATVHLLDAESGEQKGDLHWRGYPAESLSFSADGRRIAGTGGPYLRVWDLAAGKELAQLEPPDRQRGTAIMKDARFSPDGKWLAATYDLSIHVWDAATLRLAHSYRWGVGAIQRFEFSPDGLTAIAASRYGEVVVWDVEG